MFLFGYRSSSEFYLLAANLARIVARDKLGARRLKTKRRYVFFRFDYSPRFLMRMKTCARVQSTSDEATAFTRLRARRFACACARARARRASRDDFSLAHPPLEYRRTIIQFGAHAAARWLQAFWCSWHRLAVVMATFALLTSVGVAEKWRRSRKRPRARARPLASARLVA